MFKRTAYILFLFGISILLPCEVAFKTFSPVSVRTLLSPPNILSPEAVSEGVRNRFLDASWIENGGHFRFITTHTSVYFEIAIGDFFYSYGTNNKPFSQGSEYFIHEPRVVEGECPSFMTQEELFTCIQNHSVVFYTGAGLSIASGVPAMEQLNCLFGIEEGSGFLASIKKASLNPQVWSARIEEFHRACFFSPPTKAHYALKELSLARGVQLLTENLDYLHEYTGIIPYRIDAQRLKAELDPSSLSEIDYVVCVGLSHDDRGFLGWYKMHHPKGRIVAIDLKCPNYLGVEDSFVEGDAQLIVPFLKSALH